MLLYKLKHKCRLRYASARFSVQSTPTPTPPKKIRSGQQELLIIKWHDFGLDGIVLPSLVRWLCRLVRSLCCLVVFFVFLSLIHMLKNNTKHVHGPINYIDFLDLYVVMSDHNVDCSIVYVYKSDLDVDLSLIHVSKI